ncbi:carbohydrate kinase family protein [Streptomyces sp. QH1-20]|uniref:carbohydrate kinase family protein n=1 Tax=Streptomyces sp. QH1-20 TaxID=3240934 RepID=UPI003518B640
MRTAVTGSIATDHLMTFPGRITEQLLPDALASVSLSFLVDTLDVRYGGVAANIAYGLALLGRSPALVGAAGAADFEEYGARLRAVGVDTASVRLSATRHTSRFLCTTDLDGNQIAAFYAGAMTEAADIELAATARRLGGLDIVLVGADDPRAMLRHTRACRALGIGHAADPSQQLARLDGQEVRELIDGATYLFTNAYEHALLLEKSGWTHDQVLGRVGTWITTLGEQGSRVERPGEAAVTIAAVPAGHVADPTGAGDAYRAGFLAALATGGDPVRAARAGSALASLALTEVGTQTYAFDPARCADALTAAYGPLTAATVLAALTGR